MSAETMAATSSPLLRQYCAYACDPARPHSSSPKATKRIVRSYSPAASVRAR
jgi:hypothetical protein